MTDNESSYPEDEENCEFRASEIQQYNRERNGNNFILLNIKTKNNLNFVNYREEDDRLLHRDNNARQLLLKPICSQ